MKTKFLPLAGVGPVSMFAGKSALADVAPPTELVVGISLGALIGCGVLVAIVVGVSILVIRAVKKNRAPNDKS